MSPMVARRNAAEATKALFKGLPLVWGATDCGALLDGHLRNLGHESGLRQFRTYTTELGARRALMERGMANVADWMDSVPTIERINYARLVLGDIAALPSAADGDFPAGAVYMGNQTWLAFQGLTDDMHCDIVTVKYEPVAAWRVNPCRPS